MQKLIRSRITDAGRVVIPAELRRACQLEEGQDVFFCQSEQGIELPGLMVANYRRQKACGSSKSACSDTCRINF